MSALTDLLAACDSLAADTRYARKTRTLCTTLAAFLRDTHTDPGVTQVKAPGGGYDALQVSTPGDMFSVEVFEKGGVYLASEETTGNSILYIDGSLLQGDSPLLTIVNRAGVKVFEIDANGVLHTAT